MTKYSAFGCSITIAASTVIQVQNISGPGLSLDTADVTTHDSTGAWEEAVGTILRSGEVTFDIVYDPAAATHALILTQLAARAAIAMTLVLKGGVTWTFSALPTGFSPSAPHDGALTASVTYKPTGVMTLA